MFFLVRILEDLDKWTTRLVRVMFATTLLNHQKYFQRCVDLETAVEIYIPVMQAIALIEQVWLRFIKQVNR